jgi:hypothetical protein
VPTAARRAETSAEVEPILVQGRTILHTEVVIFERDQAIPEYIVRYKMRDPNPT